MNSRKTNVSITGDKHLQRHANIFMNWNFNTSFVFGTFRINLRVNCFAGVSPNKSSNQSMYLLYTECKYYFSTASNRCVLECVGGEENVILLALCGSVCLLKYSTLSKKQHRKCT